MEQSPISVLSELCQKLKIKMPQYNDSIMHTDGTFECNVEVKGLSSTGKGRSKKESKTAAARNILQSLPELNVMINYPLITKTVQCTPIDVYNPIGSLNERCIFKALSQPIYREISQSGPLHAPEFQIECRVDNMIETAIANTKKEAKKLAALKLLKRPEIENDDLNNFINIIEPNEAYKVQEKHKSLLELEPIKTDGIDKPVVMGHGFEIIHVNSESQIPCETENDLELNAISRLFEECQLKNLPTPVFTVITESGEAHAPTFLVECQLNTFTEQGSDTTKKGAKLQAARKMLQVLRGTSAKIEDFFDIIPPTECPIKRYRKIKKTDIKYNARNVDLADRHNYFKAFDDQLKCKAAEIYNGNETIREKLHSLCKTLNLEYTIEPIARHPECYHSFTLNGNFDCVLSGTYNELPSIVLEYLKVMIGFE